MNNAVLGKAITALLLSAGVLAGTAAHADVLTFDGQGNTYFGALHDTPGSYTDEFVFTIDGEDPLIATGTAIVGATGSGAVRPANYTFTSLTLFRTNVDSSRTLLATTAELGDGGLYYPYASLAPGNYGILISGATTLLNTGGSYAATLNLAPVPEPATYGMLLAGMGMLAFVGRRTKS
ncbi:FxDxF family PEP-CTERM protein [Pseudoduganella sp. LjRoot289]|uniref:FxDxF family PEP-CTERM protein n=1 Tax=Pseudoduganella sp. LjRoot289 TaxID=3342314 RepID=UPI003ECE22EA